MCPLLEIVVPMSYMFMYNFPYCGSLSSAQFCSLSYECVGIATSFSVAIASSALHKLVTVFHCV
jgi:hypothetical protein